MQFYGFAHHKLPEGPPSGGLELCGADKLGIDKFEESVGGQCHFRHIAERNETSYLESTASPNILEIFTPGLLEGQRPP